MNEVSELKRKVDYLEDTLACMRGENAALKAVLAQQTTNKQSTPPEMCEVCKVKEVVYHVCNDCYMAT